ARGRAPPRAAELGGKAWAVASAQRAGLPVPAWFAVSAAACRDGSGVPGELRAELAAAIEEVFVDGESLAVRSSACDEDGQQLSFAGQLESHLFVQPADVAERV